VFRCGETIAKHLGFSVELCDTKVMKYVCVLWCLCLLHCESCYESTWGVLQVVYECVCVCEQQRKGAEKIVCCCDQMMMMLGGFKVVIDLKDAWAERRFFLFGT
jgi:hypothetical protein